MSGIQQHLAGATRLAALRGIRAFTQGRVCDLAFDGLEGSARISGMIECRTHVRFSSDGRLTSSCTCHASDLELGICAHVYALLLAIDRTRLAGTAEISWRSLADNPLWSEPEREVRYVVRIRKNAIEPVGVRAMARQPNGGERFMRIREVAGFRPSDSALVDLITGPVADHRGFGSWNEDCPIQNERARLVLPALADTGRATVTVDGDPETPLVRDPGAPWQFGIACEVDGDGLSAKGVLVRDGEKLALDASRVVLSCGLILRGGQLGRAEFPTFSWVRTLRERTMRVAQSDVEDFAEFAATAPFTILLPDHLAYERVHASPTLVARLKTPTPRGIETALTFDYLGHHSPHREPVIDRATRRVYMRDVAAEAAWLDKARAAGFRIFEGETTIASTKLPNAVRTLMKLGARVEGERGAVFRAATRFTSQVSSGIDWLDLEAAAHFGGHAVSLPSLLAAVKRGDATVALGDGSLGLLPEEWLARFAVYGELGQTSGDAIRFARGQATIVDAMLEALPEIEGDAVITKLRKALAKKPAPRNAPKAFVGELREYQRDGLGWLHWLEREGLGGCLADDMGLGKTVQVLAHLANRRSKKPSLVVAPRSVVFNWRNEAERFTPKLRVIEHVGTDRNIARFAKADVVLTTYGTLRRDIEALAAIEFDYAILDEAQAIKNRGSISAKAARLIRADHRLVLTGTPVENHLSDLGSLFLFIEPGLLDAPSLDRIGQHDSDEVRATLARILRPFVLRRTKAQVATELPDRIEQTRFVDLDQAERARYTQLRDHYRKTILQKSDTERGTNVLEAILRLRQAACHPALLDATLRDAPSAKVSALVAELEEVTSAGHKALVFSQFTSLLSVVRARLDALGLAYEYLDGQTTDRKGCVERFQDAAGAKVFLISLKAGGVGLNLTAAEYVFLLDPWWNPAVEAQAIDRAHRIGQTRTVMAYRLIAKDTIEERVLSLQQSKRALFESLFGDSGTIGGLTTADLDVLLS